MLREHISIYFMKIEMYIYIMDNGRNAPKKYNYKNGSYLKNKNHKWIRKK